MKAQRSHGTKSGVYNLLYFRTQCSARDSWSAISVLPGPFPRHQLSFSENELGSLLKGFSQKFSSDLLKFIFRKWKLMSWKWTWKHTYSRLRISSWTLSPKIQQIIYSTLCAVTPLRLHQSSKIPHKCPRTWALTYTKNWIMLSFLLIRWPRK